MTDNKLTHFDASGNAVMVDVSEKTVTFREATAHGIITMNAEAFAAVESGTSIVKIIRIDAGPVVNRSNAQHVNHIARFTKVIRLSAT